MGHNGTHKDLIGQEPHHRWRKCCLTQLPFWSGPGLPASQMTQPKSEDGAAPPPPAQPPSPTAQRTPSYWAAAELFLVPWLLTVLVLPAPPWLDLGGNCPGQTKALAAAGATKLQAGAPDSASAGWLLSVTWCWRG